MIYVLYYILHYNNSDEFQSSFKFICHVCAYNIIELAKSYSLLGDIGVEVNQLQFITFFLLVHNYTCRVFGISRVVYFKTD